MRRLLNITDSECQSYVMGRRYSFGMTGEFTARKKRENDYVLVVPVTILLFTMERLSKHDVDGSENVI